MMFAASLPALRSAEGAYPAEKTLLTNKSGSSPWGSPLLGLKRKQNMATKGRVAAKQKLHSGWSSKPRACWRVMPNHLTKSWPARPWRMSCPKVWGQRSSTWPLRMARPQKMKRRVGQAAQRARMDKLWKLRCFLKWASQCTRKKLAWGSPEWWSCWRMWKRKLEKRRGNPWMASLAAWWSWKSKAARWGWRMPRASSLMLPSKLRR